MVFSRSTSPMPMRLRVVAFAAAICAGSFLRTASACAVDADCPTMEARRSTEMVLPAEFTPDAPPALAITCLPRFAASHQRFGAFHKSGPQVSLSGPLTSDSVAGVAVTTGSSGGPGQPFTAIIKVNGWVTSHMGFVWNEATQSWVAQWLIPPGSKGSTVTVTITASDGSTTTTSFVVQ